MLTEQHIRKFGFVPVEQHLAAYPDMTLYRHPTGIYIAKNAEHKFYYVGDDNKPVSLNAAELQMYKHALVTLIKRARCVDEIKYICEEFCTEKHKGTLKLWLKATDAINPHPYRIPELLVTLILNS